MLLGFLSFFGLFGGLLLGLHLLTVRQTEAAAEQAAAGRLHRRLVGLAGIGGIGIPIGLASLLLGRMAVLVLPRPLRLHLLGLLHAARLLLGLGVLLLKRQHALLVGHALPFLIFQKSSTKAAMMNT